MKRRTYSLLPFKNKKRVRERVRKMNSNIKGNIALGQAIAYFTKEGYIISIPLNDSQQYDLIIEKNNIFQSVQVKYTSEKSRNKESYICTLKTTSGTTREKIYSITETSVDLLFCYCENGEKYLIPIKEITNNNSITLSKKILKTGFDTSKYYLS